jgi:hypothetical protein
MLWQFGELVRLVSSLHSVHFVRGAQRMTIVDDAAYRLDFAVKTMPKIETVDFSEDSTSTAGENQVLELCRNEPIYAPDCCTEAVGMLYTHSFMHQAEMAVGLETDTSDNLNAVCMEERWPHRCHWRIRWVCEPQRRSFDAEKS